MDGNAARCDCKCSCSLCSCTGSAWRGLGLHRAGGKASGMVGVAGPCTWAGGGVLGGERDEVEPGGDTSGKIPAADT